MTTATNHYDVLGVHHDASPDDIKKAWRQAAKAAHPDKNQEGDANKRMAAINTAYEVLSDSKKRAAHDKKLSNQSTRQQRATSRPYSSDIHRGDPTWRDDARTRAQRSRQHEDARRRAEETARTRGQTERDLWAERERERAEAEARWEAERERQAREAAQQAEEQRKAEELSSRLAAERRVQEAAKRAQAALERTRSIWRKAADRREEAMELSNYEIQAEEKRRAKLTSDHPEPHADPSTAASADTTGSSTKPQNLSNVRSGIRIPVRVVRSIWKSMSTPNKEDLHQPEQDPRHTVEAALRIAWESRKEELRLAEIGRQHVEQLETRAEEHASQGLASVRKGDFERALAEFSDSIALDPKAAPLLVARGAVYSAMGRNVAAIDDFSVALRQNPEDASVLGQRAEAYVKQRQYDLALRDLDAALSLDPRNPDFLQLRSVVNTQLGNWR